MRWTLISLLCLVTISNALGQKNVFSERIESQSPINIGLDKVDKRFTAPSFELKQLKSGTIANSNIHVTYVGFPETAKKAFEYAVSIWEQHLSSPIPITVVATWENMQGNILAHSRPAGFYKNFDDALISDVYYPIALVEKLSNKEWNGSKEADILCSFSSNTSWYFGTDGNTPVSNYDFVTVVLHEMAHGLGISGFLSDENGLGKINNSACNPSAYDYYIYNSYKQRISDNSIFNSPSAELHNQLTSNKLDFGCNNTESYSLITEIHAPTTWKDGVSIYHLKSSQTGSQDDHHLMSPYLSKGEANHNPGESTVKVLSEIGWGSKSFSIDEIKDIEETASTITVKTKLNSNISLANSTFQIIFSTNNFSSKDSATFTFNQEEQLFEANLPINNYKGKVNYYFTAKTGSNETVYFPKQAPQNLFSFKIGPDYYSPLLKHNPTKLASTTNSTVEFTAIASDNLGIESVKIEYRINGAEQKPFQLNNKTADIYNGKLQFPAKLNRNDKIEYRIIALDCSARKNKKFLPKQGFFQIEVFESFEPVSGYVSDFNTANTDFTTTDFEINTPSGFNSGILHTSHPYPTSELENQKYNLIAQLNHPVILVENGQMTFDEIVLVEPAESGTNFTDDLFWDYVIVEASKNNGESWHALEDGYDSGICDSWYSRFSNSLKSSASSAVGTESMFLTHTINLTENSQFSEGDTVIFRFRLSSDKTINGWGWAIDNLKIQSLNTDAEEIASERKINVYPNPCKNNLFIDCKEIINSTSVEINITDLYGKTVYRETNYDIQYDPRLTVDLTNINSGIYIASITDSNSNSFTQKIIKN